MRTEKHEVFVKHPVEEVWRVSLKNFQAILPKVVPQHYASVEFLDGPPLAPGGVFLVTYNSASFPHFDSLKAVWDAIDHENHYCKVRILEGGHLGECSGANCSYSLKLVPGPDPNSCINQLTFEYDDVSEKEVHEYMKEEMSIFGKAIESYLSSKA